MPCILIASIVRWGTAWFMWLLKSGVDFAWRNPFAGILTRSCPWKLRGVRVRATCREAVQAGISRKVIKKKKSVFQLVLQGET